jgi:hypothetical protein
MTNASALMTMAWICDKMYPGVEKGGEGEHCEFSLKRDFGASVG